MTAKKATKPNLDHIKLAIERIPQVYKKFEKQVPGAYNAFFGGIDLRGSVTGESAGGCHAGIARIMGASVVYSKWAPEPSKENDLYLAWLISPDSPWRDAFPPEEVEVDGQDIWSHKFIRDNGFIFWHTDRLPSNVQHQLLIASRVPRQHKDKIKTWYKLVTEYNCDPAFAYIWMTCWFAYAPIKEKGSIQATPNYMFECFDKRAHNYIPYKGNQGEFNFDTYTSQEDAVVNFLLGRMDKEKLNAPFRDNPRYYPVNILWGNNGIMDEKKRYLTAMVSRYSKKYGFIKEERSFFNMNTVEQFVIDRDAYIEITELEQEYLLKKAGIKDVRKFA
jgi:hypothetical protein